MKNKNNILIYILLMIISLCHYGNIEVNNYNNSYYKRYDLKNKACNESASDFSYELVIESQIVNFNDDIVLKFEKVESSYSFNAYLSHSTFFTNDTITAVGNSIDVRVTNDHSSGEHSFTVNITDESDSTNILCTQNIYIFSDGIKDYVSASCIEECRDLYYINNIATHNQLKLLGRKEATEGEVLNGKVYDAHQEYSNHVYKEDTQKDIECTYSLNDDEDDGIYRISGYIKYTDKNGNLHPLKNNRVKLCDYDSLDFNETLDMTTTDSLGYFEFNTSIFNWFEYDGQDVYIRLEPRNNSSHIVNWFDVYTYFTPICYNLSEEEKMEYNITINTDVSSRASSFIITQMMLFPYNYAKEMSNQNLAPLQIIYPFPSDTCFCAPLFENYIINKIGYMGFAKGYEHEWDVGAHEYGHYLAHNYGMTYLQLGTHFMKLDLTTMDRSIYYKTKYFSTKLAWSEGIATYLGLASQLYFNGASYNIPYMGDNGYHQNVENSSENYYYYSNIAKGENNEGMIAYFLMDLMDNDNLYNTTTITGENIALGHQAVWNLLTTRNNGNLSDFMPLLQNGNLDYLNSLGKLQEHYGFSAKNLNNDTYFDLEATNNILTWSVNTNSAILSELSSFNLIFYSEDLTNSYEIENIETTTYTLSLEDLETLLQFNSDVIYWQVEGYNHRQDAALTYDLNVPCIITGPYYSSFSTIQKQSLNVISMVGSYSASLNDNEYKWYEFRAPIDDTFTFETTGDIDTYVELFPSIVANGSIRGRLATDDDSGDSLNFKISYELNKGDRLYLRISSYLDEEEQLGTFIFKITSSHTHTYTYESVNSITHKASCECGYFVLQAHAIKTSGTSRYKPCIQCGYLVDTGTDIGIVGPLNKGNLRTINGSYVSTKGIVMLVDEDIESYLNGTLEFYSNNEELIKK